MSTKIMIRCPYCGALMHSHKVASEHSRLHLENDAIRWKRRVENYAKVTGNSIEDAEHVLSEI